MALLALNDTGAPAYDHHIGSTFSQSRCASLCHHPRATSVMAEALLKGDLSKFMPKPSAEGAWDCFWIVRNPT
ncbi:MAG: hypothetical protein IPJ49_30785 [Candidatus Obscuribacter sp.]|nr:hypothetical protein [Candidatus Obscuribacter sp.]